MSIHFCELLLRDGIQGWPEVVPTDAKIELANKISQAGVAEIDLTSFVPAHVVPQFGDAEAVLEHYEGDARIRVLTVNAKGAARVIEAHRQIRPIQVCGMPFSASEAHNLANLRCDHATHKERIKGMVAMLADAGITPMVCVATAWGCPIAGEIPPEVVHDHVGWLHSIGVSSIMLGDTTGMADPLRVKELFTALIRDYPGADFIAHFHDNRGCGIANVLAAVEVGVREVDGCLGGLGGEPASVEQGNVGASGNVVSEDLIAVMDRMGLDTGIDIDKFIEAGNLAERVIGRPLFSKILRAGAVG